MHRGTEVFSENPGAFDEEMRKKIQEEAVLVAALLAPENAVDVKGYELNDSEPGALNHLAGNVTTAADTWVESEPALNFYPAKTTKSTSDNWSRRLISLHSDSSFPVHSGRRGWKIIVFVLAVIVGISAILFIRNADHNSSAARRSAPVLVNSRSSTLSTVVQSSGVPPSRSEYEKQNAVNTSVRRLMDSAASGDVTSQVSLADRYAKGDGVAARQGESGRLVHRCRCAWKRAREERICVDHA